MESKKEQWVESALNSLNGIGRAVPSSEFQAEVMRRIQAGRNRIEMVSQVTVYRAAAAILLIITLNVMSCIVFQKNISEEKELKSLAREFLINQGSEALLNL